MSSDDDQDFDVMQARCAKQRRISQWENPTAEDLHGTGEDGPDGYCPIVSSKDMTDRDTTYDGMPRHASNVVWRWMHQWDFGC